MRIDLTTRPVVQKLRYCFEKLGLTTPVWYEPSEKKWFFVLHKQIRINKLAALSFVEACALGRIETLADAERYFASATRENFI